MALGTLDAGPPIAGRLLAVDWMRGLVMILMAVDHAGGAFDAHHLVTDSPVLYEPWMPLPLGHFLTRWITHLCAPTFVFLAGTALALSVEKRRLEGRSERQMDRHILLRGAFIVALDPTLVTLAHKWMHPNPILFQVLYAIGAGLMAMAFLRRLSTQWLLLIATLLIVPMEAVTLLFWDGRSWDTSVPGGLLLTVGMKGPFIFIYPLLPWLAMMILGYLLGRRLVRRPDWRPERLLVLWGLAGLALYALVRWVNGYGNMLLYREYDSLAQWLHVCKYPPALAFTALELGLMALCLAGFFRLERRLRTGPCTRNPVVVLGQTALLFYLLHIPLLTLFAKATGLMDQACLPAVYLGAAAAVVTLYPVCLAYRNYKASHPGGWTRFL